MITWLVLPPVVYGIADSRAYRFPFVLRCAKDLPRDFYLSRDLLDFSFGLFLPQFENSRGDAPYPPTAILRHNSGLSVASRGEPYRIIPFNRVRYIEYGHFWLQGWIDFPDLSTRNHFPFHALMNFSIEEFLRRLTSEYRSADQRSLSRSEVAPVDLPVKFQNAERTALALREQVLSRFFTSATPPSASSPRTVRRGGPGDYLALTSRRLLWITDRHRGLFERYGCVLRFVSLESLAAIHIGFSGVDCMLHCRLRDGTSWSIPLASQVIDMHWRS
jgi:hypothetical protein